MKTDRSPELPACNACRDGDAFDIPITMAFQPIVDAHARVPWAYEALVRGVDGSGAMAVLARVNDTNRYAFDQACRVKAVELAARLGMDCLLSINFLPNAVYQPATCLRATLLAARTHGFPTERLLFELTETELLHDIGHLCAINTEYRKRGFRTAIDDFGAGYSGLGLLSQFQPDVIKVDMALVRNIDQDPVRQAIVRGLLVTTAALGIEVVAEGIERAGEYAWLRDAGVRLFQGYLFARPQVEALPAIAWPD